MNAENNHRNPHEYIDNRRRGKAHKYQKVRNSHKYQKDFLLYTSTGDRPSIHHWLPDRNFDLAITYYGNSTCKYKKDANFYLKNKDNKFANFYYMYQKYANIINKYKAVFILDDDIIISGKEINRLFNILMEYNLKMLQPSMNPIGKVDWDITKQQKNNFLRFTNFVEMNVPMIAIEPLKDFMKVYNPKINWGVDLWMLKHFGDGKFNYAIIDDISCINPLDNNKGDGGREINLCAPEIQSERLFWRFNKGKKLGIKGTDLKKRKEKGGNAILAKVHSIITKQARSKLIKLKAMVSDLPKRNDITVVIGVKNRCDFRLINALKSIRNQDYNKKLIDIILVDYDSDKNFIKTYKEICKQHTVNYIRIENKPVWSRSHCLNIGIKKAKTKYTLTTDTDMIFEKNYIRTAIEELQKSPSQIIVAEMHGTVEGNITPDTDVIKDYKKLKKIRRKMKDIEKVKDSEYFYGKSINLTYTKFYHHIHGYDEFFEVWGAEDDDLMKRFLLLGLTMTEITSKTSYIHQWHPRWEGTELKSLEDKQYKKNFNYYLDNNSIIRNKDGWGKI